MSHEMESMAYLGQTPWHGLGHKLEQAATVDEMTTAAGIDWAVEQVPTFALINGEYVEISERKAIVRQTDSKILATSSNEWKPFQNKELMEFFREYAEAGACTLETAGSLHGGKTIWALANINKGFALNGGRDKVDGYLLLSNSHAPGSAIRVMTTMVRVVCQNTLSMAHGAKNDSYRQSHMREFDVSAAKATVDLAREQMGHHEDEAKALHSLKLSTHDVIKVLAKHFQPDMADDFNVQVLTHNPNAQSEIMSRVLWSVAKGPGAEPDNAWGVLNGYTHYADHVAGKTAESRLTNATFGRNAKVKLDLRRDLLEMADYKLAA